MRASLRCGLFLDRDGTLIVDVGYPRDPAEVQLLPGAAESLRELQQVFALVIVTNQSGIARGRITPEQAMAVQQRCDELFFAQGVSFAGVYMCPHGPNDGCQCRKPEPGMLLAAAADLELDLARSVMVGDKESDRDAGRAAGCAKALRFAPDQGAGWPNVLTELMQLAAGSTDS